MAKWGTQGKRVRVRLVGGQDKDARQVILNPLTSRTWEAMLEAVSSSLPGCPCALRGLYTPEGREVSFPDLQQGGLYVAVPRNKAGQGQTNRHYEPTRPGPKKQNFNFMRYEPPLVIHVYQNGKHEPAKKFIFNRSQQNQFSHMLDIMSPTLKLARGPVRRLWTLDGGVISDPSQLVSGEYYVATSQKEAFKLDFPYGAEMVLTSQNTRLLDAYTPFASVATEDGEFEEAGSSEDREEVKIKSKKLVGGRQKHQNQKKSNGP